MVRLNLSFFLLVVVTALQLRFLDAVRIAVVSQRPYHLEIVCGFMHVLQKHSNTTTVYLHYLNMPGHRMDFGFLDWVKDYKGDVRALPVLSPKLPKHDVVIFVTPEYNMKFVRDFLHYSRAKLAILMVHNADHPNVPEFQFIHKNVRMITLAPHVSNYLKTRYELESEWLLPIDSLQPAKECSSTTSIGCTSGFAIQGNMDSTRRNYGDIWQQLGAQMLQSNVTQLDWRLSINVIGNGNPDALHVPAAIMGRVATHVNLSFTPFYNSIYHNIALLPVLGSDAYVKTKFSSTVVSSLITGVPLVATQQMLEAYTFLNESTTYMQRNGEDTMDVMVRILGMSSNELQRHRVQLQALREDLNRRSLSLLESWFANPKGAGKRATSRTAHDNDQIKLCRGNSSISKKSNVIIPCLT
jgi:hypothetical protein